MQRITGTTPRSPVTSTRAAMLPRPLRTVLTAAVACLVLVSLAAPPAGADTPIHAGLLWCRYLGGTGEDEASRVLSDGEGGVWVAGTTADATSWETEGVSPVRAGPGGGDTDAFLARLDAEGRLKVLLFLGGSAGERVGGLVRTAEGDVIIVGGTGSADFPTSAGAVQPDSAGATDAFVAKVDAAGTLQWATLLGGSPGYNATGNDFAAGAGLLSDGSIVVAGRTSSFDFPAVDPLQLTKGTTAGDGFVAVLSPDGGSLRFSTPIGGSGADEITAVAVDGSDRIVAAGTTWSVDFPVTRPHQGSSAGPADAFVLALSWPSREVLFSTYLGGSAEDAAEAVAVDGEGRPVISGATATLFAEPAFGGFPLTPGAYDVQTTLPYAYDLFVTTLDAAGSNLLSSTVLPLELPPPGPAGVFVPPPEGISLHVDSEGRRWATGWTDSPELPVVGALQSHLEEVGTWYRHGSDGFVSVLAEDETALVFSTYLGGSGFDVVRDLAFAADGTVLLSGNTESADFPGAFNAYHGSGDAFVASLTTASSALAATATASPASGLAPLEVTFAGRASGGSGIYTYRWDFGDGSPYPPRQDVRHTYGVGGTYTATFTVTDSDGSTVSFPVQITVSATCAIGCSATVPLVVPALATTPLAAVRFTSTASPSSDCPLTPAFLWEFGDGTTSTEQNPSHAYAAQGIYEWRLTVTLGGHTCQHHGTVTVTDLSDVSSVQIIPAAAHNPGVDGTLWRTDLTAVNRGASPANLAIVYATAEGSTLRTATVPAGGTVEWPDILASLFGVPMEATSQGTLQVASDRPVAVVARTYDETTAGTLGAAYPALGPANGITSVQTGILPGLKSSTGFRTNLGLVNLGGSDGQARVTLYAASGEALGAPLVLSLPGGRWVPVNDVFSQAAAGAQDLAYATVEVLTPGARVWAYASVVDNGTGDPTMVPMIGN